MGVGFTESPATGCGGFLQTKPTDWKYVVGSKEITSDMK